MRTILYSSLSTEGDAINVSIVEGRKVWRGGLWFIKSLQWTGLDRSEVLRCISQIGKQTSSSLQLFNCMNSKMTNKQVSV